jgi:multidrug efflux pump
MKAPEIIWDDPDAAVLTPIAPKQPVQAAE